MEEISLKVESIETPKLVVNEKNDAGTIKISGVPENVSKKSVNFGPGLDLLMNPNRQSRPNSPKSEINLSDINNLDKDLNKQLKSPKEMREKVFSSGLSAPPPTPNVTNNIKKTDFDLPEIKISKPDLNSKLGEKTTDLGNDKSGLDDMKKFNDIPINPDIKIEEPKLSPEQVLKEKLIYLRKLEAMEKQGVKLSKKYSMDSDLNEMKGEFEMIKAEKEKKSSCKFQGKMLMAFVSGLEFLNSKFDPFDLKLDGWAESVHENIDDYDEVFGELHEKYGGKTKMSPELKLLFMLGGSGFMLHMTNTMFKSSIPGMDDIMKQNPELMQQFTQAAVNTMGQSNPGFGNFMSGVMGNNQMPVPPRMPPPSRPDFNYARGEPEIREVPKQKSRRPEMKGPSGDVNSLLAGLKTKNINIKNDKSSTVSASELKEMKMDMDNMPKKSRRKKSERNTISLQL
tara:strand:- start:4113 stop:5474 length:1362 start_codon:yes stop_codon:yes gene_type:complete